MGNSQSRKNQFRETKQKMILDTRESLVAGKIYNGSVGHFTMNSGKLDEDLLSFLLDDDWLSKSDDELLKIGFYKAVDNPGLENHHYFEGYFHGRSEPNSIKSLNPRNGRNMNKPAGPARIRAFIQATRQKNEKLLTKVAACFDEKSSIRKLFESQNIFCDIAIQIRYADLHFHF